MKKPIFILLAVSMITSAHAQQSVQLANDLWSPFILDGEQLGTSEKIVCGALERQGWTCGVEVKEWQVVLEEAKAGSIDGIAALWRNPERDQYLLFSEPYLSNRIIPVVNSNDDVQISEAGDLTGLRVALVADYAYGDTIESLKSEFTVVEASTSTDALSLVANGETDAALIDELVARDRVGTPVMDDLIMLNTVIEFRDLHFAVSRQNPQAEEIIADFQRGYLLMLSDGTVNEILNVDWLATDFGQSGDLNVVMRSGISLDNLEAPSNDGEVFALDASEFDVMKQRNMDPSRVKYQVDGQSYSTLQSALDDVFGENTPCKHQNYTSQFDCSGLFKK